MTPVMRASGLGGPRPRKHVDAGLADRLFACQTEADAADFGFVHDIGRMNFHCDRTATGEERAGCRSRFVGITGQE